MLTPLRQLGRRSTKCQLMRQGQAELRWEKVRRLQSEMGDTLGQARTNSATSKGRYLTAASATSQETRNDIRIIPDRVTPTWSVGPLISMIEHRRPGEALDDTLRAIADRYGAPTANAVAMQLEYYCCRGHGEPEDIRPASETDVNTAIVISCVADALDVVRLLLGNAGSGPYRNGAYATTLNAMSTA